MCESMRESLTDKIYAVVKRIPKGKVATYGMVAEAIGNRHLSRAVGNALHKNPDPRVVPCYRVVNAEGKLAEQFAFGGMKGQAAFLREEGVEVRNGHVDLAKYIADRL